MLPEVKARCKATAVAFGTLCRSLANHNLLKMADRMLLINPIVDGVLTYAAASWPLLSEKDLGMIRHGHYRLLRLA
eukprot:3058789-Prorocentrum_lima.AAC.1